MFEDPWYNFIVPTVNIDKLDWDLSMKIIQSQQESGIKPSYYIKDVLKKSYKSKLDSLGFSEIGNDTYMYLKIKKKFEKVDIQAEKISESEEKAYIKTAKSCFPDFSSEEKYCRYFFKIAKLNKNRDIIASNLRIYEGKEIASFSSIYGSKKQNIAYLHNDGTAKSFRRRGYHSQLIKIRCNMAFDNGIENIYAILEEGGASYNSYLKLGFKPVVTYHLFSKI